LKQHPRKNKTAINIEYMKASIRAGGAPVSHHQAAVRLRESQIQGLLKNDNQLAMLFTPPTCFGWTK
jgi:IS5 family transposase